MLLTSSTISMSKILFVHQEILPYVEENTYSHIGRYLPQGIQELGHEIRTFMPLYGCINERRNQLHEVIRLSGMNMIINSDDHSLTIKVTSIPSARMQIYFIDNDDYFQRKFITRDAHNTFFKDNDERMIFFARGTLETIKKLRWQPDLVHCAGWFSMITPLMVKKGFLQDPLFRNTKVVVNLYDDDFSENFDPDFYKKLVMLTIKPENCELLKENTFEGVMKFALSYADGLIIGAENVNQNIVDYAKSLNLPILPYQGAENYFQEYSNFYEQILSNQ